MHNGALKSLWEVVHFYNTRDVEDWPPPEVSENVNTDELGDLGLTTEEENLIVAFMRTLSDGYTAPAKPVGQSAARAMSLELLGPNPVGSTATLSFSMPEPGRVQVYLYSVTGQRVATLCDGWRDAGPHSLSVEAAGLPSGVYFVQLVGEKQSLTNKLVLLK
jgi:hypothetical protein